MTEELTVDQLVEILLKRAIKQRQGFDDSYQHRTKEENQ